MRDLLKVFCIFDPHQLPVLSKQRAAYEWQIYLDLAAEKSDLMTLSHFPTCSKGKATKLSTSKGLHRPANSLCGY